MSQHARKASSRAANTGVYHFGDDWIHKIKVEKVVPSNACAAPTCLGGANACPPEDIGGPYGYADFLEAIADPTHPEHQNMLEWSGGQFDPTALNPDAIAFRLQRVKL